MVRPIRTPILSVDGRGYGPAIGVHRQTPIPICNLRSTTPIATENLVALGLLQPGTATADTLPARMRRGSLTVGLLAPNRPWMNAMSRPTSVCFPGMLV